jgi:hypothetical protein
MSISGTIRQDRKYPMIGDGVTLAVDGLTAGHRVRWRVLSAPALSTVELYEAQIPNSGYLPPKPCNGTLLQPDTHGEYVLEAVEESFVSHIPHFSNDPTNALEEWTETATESYSVYVGSRVTRSLGVGADRVTLEAFAHDAGASDGVLTYWCDRNRCPKLIDPTSDRAKLAMAMANVTDAIAYYGGKGYVGTADMIVAETDFLMVPSTLLGLIVGGFNLHIAYTANNVHGAADAANVMTAVAAPTDLATLITYLNTLRTKYIAHIGLGVATHPGGADATNTLSIGACSTLATAISLYNDIRSKYGLHRIRYSPLFATGHSLPGDAILASRETWQLAPSTSTLATMITKAVALAAAWDSHLAKVVISAAYHANADTDNEMTTRTPISDPDLIALVNECATKLEAHAANVVWSTNVAAAAGYHAVVDSGCKVPTRATDKASAIEVLDYLLWAYVHHVDHAGDWHGGLNAGRAYAQGLGVTLIHKYLLDKLQGYETTAPANILEAVDNMVRLGGFTLG